MIQPNHVILTICLVAGTLFAAPASTQEMPLGFDRALQAIELPAYALTLEPHETASFDTRGVARITIGETSIISKRYDEAERRFTVTADEPGTTMLRVFRKDGSEVSIEVTVRASGD